MLLIVLCGYQVLSLISQEEHRLNIFENKILGKILELEREKIQERK